MKNFIKNNWQILLVETLVLIIFTLFYGRFGDITVDSFREIYIAQEILDGKALYKDIFVIYSPLSYLINAFLIKITTIKTCNIFYFAGLLTTMGILFLTNRISDIFIDKKCSLAINIFIISALVLSPNVFNSFLPYSYGVLYGVLFVLTSVYFALRKQFPVAYLFYALAILSKYEFLFLLPALIFLSKKEKWGKNLISFIIPIILTGFILLAQGITFEDIKTALYLTLTMCQTKTLHWFYSSMGLIFRPELIPIYLMNILKFFCPIYWVKYQEILIWAFPIILITGIIKIKTLTTNERFFILATLLISLKVFWALTIQSYGVYFLPFALISIFILFPNKIKKYMCVLLIFWSIIIGSYNISALLNKTYSLPNIVNYIKTNTSLQDKVVVYPEGLYLNILSNRKSDSKFYSLTPLYTETFGEELITKRLDTTKPKYIIISNYDTSNYYFKEFGKDYATQVYLWINENYLLKNTIEDKWIFKIYELKS